MRKNAIGAATAAVSLILLAGVAPAPVLAKGGCVLAGGEATMITPDLAKFMASAALKNSISGMGAKPAGAVKMKCTEGFPTTHCIARQRACK